MTFMVLNFYNPVVNHTRSIIPKGKLEVGLKFHFETFSRKYIIYTGTPRARTIIPGRASLKLVNTGEIMYPRETKIKKSGVIG